MTNREIIDATDRTQVGVYARFPVAFVRGKGARLWDADGKSYLDFFTGLAVNNLGHGHPRVVAAIREQTEKLLHASNVYYNEPAAKLGELLTGHSFADRVFFCNSGAEANEAAIKLARKHGAERRGGRYEILTVLGSFHGRTLATLSATAQEKYQAGFQPLVPGFRYVPFGDVEAMTSAVRDETIGILVEPIQGEGGVNIPPPGYLQRLRDLCDERDLLLMLDEVQVGMGRTGTLFAHEHENVRPDIMTLAKALGGGVPIGAMLTTEAIAQALDPGTHGSTFGGNPLACAAGTAVLQTLLEDGVLDNCRAMGAHIRERLIALGTTLPMIREVRGLGLIVGIELDRPGRPFVAAALERGLVINCTADKVIRLLPPLTITAAEVDEGLAILADVLRGDRRRSVAARLVKRDLLSIGDLSRADCEAIFALAKALKAAVLARRKHRRLEGRAMAMIFEKPSLRTRVTFEIGISQLGGTAVYLAPGDIRLGERESVPDIARNLSRWVDLIVARTFAHEAVRGLATNATVPVVNALSDLEHPCQVLADCFTLLEKRRRLAGLKVAFVGDGNNMVHSWMLAASLLGIEFRLACPPGYEPSPQIVAAVRHAPGAQVTITHSVEDAVRGADALYTDVWTSMGQEAEETKRREAFLGYQVNAGTLRLAAPRALVMHCLPAHRGDEITGDVLDGPQSIVLDQAENRLHVQKAIMVWLSSATRSRPRRKKR